MSPWERIIGQPPSGGHFVQLYEADETALTRNVGQYLGEGLRRGEGVLVIATPERRQLFCEYLDNSGVNPQSVLHSGQMVFLDARQTLSLIMANGQPDWRNFEKGINEAMRLVKPLGDQGLRAYGEMVGLLWKARQFAAAIRLEQLWNRKLEQSSFSLYCAYAIDIFGQEFDVANLDGVLCTHTHLVPAQTDGSLEAALHRSMDEILGPKADALRILIKANYRPAWAVMPGPESIVLWLRKNLPEEVDNIVRLARHHYHSQLQVTE